MVRHGVRVPHDTAIVGFDDKRRYKLGRRAAEQLLDEACNPDYRHEQQLFEPELLVRESSMVRRQRKGAA
jgi:LacI family transcriptional regulator